MSDLSPLPQQSINKKGIKDLVHSLKVIYTDVDGTLVGPRGCFLLDADNNFTLKPARALLDAHRQGIDVVMVSGRNRLQLHEDARILGMQNYIAEMGCQIIYEQGREVLETAETLLADRPARNVHEIIEQSGAVELLFMHFKGALEYHTPWSSRRECSHLFRGFIDVDQANSLLDQAGFPWLKMEDNGLIKSAGSLRDLPEIHAYHLLPRQSGKVKAVQIDLNKRHFLRHQAAAIGDALTDLELANHVGAFFLVKNAVSADASIKAAVEHFDNIFLTTKEMGLGFAEVLEFLLTC